MVRPKHTGGVGSILTAKKGSRGERIGDPWVFGIPQVANGGSYLDLRTQFGWNGAPYFAMSADGGVVVAANTQSNLVQGYSLSTPFSFAGVEASGAGWFNPAHGIGGLAFKPDGTRMYLFDTGPQRIKQYDLSVPWDVSTAVFSGQSPIVAPTYFTSMSVAFDGSKLVCFIGSSTLYTMSMVDWDVTSGTLSSAFTVPSLPGLGSIHALQMTPDGGKLAVLSVGNGVSTGLVSLATPGNPASTWTLDGMFIYTNNSPGTAHSGAFAPDGLHVYLSRYSSGSYSGIYGYSLEDP